jgi:hypothetical protein
MIIAKLVWKMKDDIFEVDTVFLDGDLSEEIYMDTPHSMNFGSRKNLILKVVQSAREFYNKTIEVP